MPSSLTNPTGVSRRAFCAGGAALAAAALLPRRIFAVTATDSAPPFTLGVASGDPAPDGFVIWTRLAPRPLEPGGGMPSTPVEVEWVVAEDEALRHVVRRTTATASPEWAHSVHVEVDGLPPDRWYWYRFTTGGAASAVGRARTLPAAGATAQRLRFAFASCQKYEVGYYTAYEHMAREDLDLIVFLGDYIYEKDDDDEAVRPHGFREVFTLDDYRVRYALYKSDPALQAAHARAPWIVTWDDHEVSNDYAGAVHQFPERHTREEFLARRAAAYRAYYEHMPLRRTARPAGPDLQLYRRLDYGTLATFHVLDTRQYRTDQPAGPRRQSAGPQVLDPAATMLGAEQRRWFFAGLAGSPAQWNIIAQQVIMAQVDVSTAGPGPIVDVDKWAGYEHERREILRFLRDRRIANPVVITGDIHSNWANELSTDFDDPAAPPVAVEFVGTSISSGGHGVDRPDHLDALLARNPCVKFHNNERGYVRCEVTPEEWRTDFRTVPDIARRDGPLLTRASFRVAAGQPRLQRI